MIGYNTRDIMASGYKEFSIVNRELYKLADRFFQKSFNDESQVDLVVKYFIDVYWYDNSKYLVEDNYTSAIYEVSLFINETKSFRISITSHEDNFSTIEEIESFIESQYVNLNCIPNIHNN